MLKLFVLEDDFHRFKQRKRNRKPRQVSNFIDGVENYKYVKKVIIYQEGYYLLQLSSEAPFHYLLPGDLDFKSNDLQELEYELFLSYLQGGDC